MSQEKSSEPTGSEPKESSNGPDHADKSDKGKHKEESTLSERMQRSTNMMLSSLGSSNGDISSAMGDSKVSHMAADNRNRIERALGEASTAKSQNRPADTSIRTSGIETQTEAAFSEFQQQTGLRAIDGDGPHLTGATGSALREQEALDGDAVLQILADTSVEHGHLSSFSPEEVDDMFTPDEQARLQKALFDVPRRGVPWATLLDPAHDLLPDLEDAQVTEMLFGTTDSESSRQQWLDQWRDVLSSYTDEVWGDLGSLAGDAKAEVSRLLEDQGDQPNKHHQALDRLRLVLAHLRG
jgi:hypothetical protein